MIILSIFTISSFVATTYTLKYFRTNKKVS
jgi:hypothetical protein